MPQLIYPLKWEAVRCVVDTGCDGGNAGDGEHAGEDLELHWDKVGEDETWAVHKAHIRGPEEGLEVLCLVGWMSSVREALLACRVRTFPGVRDAVTLCVPKRALRRDDFPTLG